MPPKKQPAAASSKGIKKAAGKEVKKANNKKADAAAAKSKAKSTSAPARNSSAGAGAASSAIAASSSSSSGAANKATKVKPTDKTAKGKKKDGTTSTAIAAGASSKGKSSTGTKATTVKKPQPMKLAAEKSSKANATTKAIKVAGGKTKKTNKTSVSATVASSNKGTTDKASGSSPMNKKATKMKTQHSASAHMNAIVQGLCEITNMAFNDMRDNYCVHMANSLDILITKLDFPELKVVATVNEILAGSKSVPAFKDYAELDAFWDFVDLWEDLGLISAGHWIQNHLMNLEVSLSGNAAVGYVDSLFGPGAAAAGLPLFPPPAGASSSSTAADPLFFGAATGFLPPEGLGDLLNEANFGAGAGWGAVDDWFATAALGDEIPLQPKAKAKGKAKAAGGKAAAKAKTAAAKTAAGSFMAKAKAGASWGDVFQHALDYIGKGLSSTTAALGSSSSAGGAGASSSSKAKPPPPNPFAGAATSSGAGASGSWQPVSWGALSSSTGKAAGGKAVPSSNPFAFPSQWHQAPPPPFSSLFSSTTPFPSTSSKAGSAKAKGGAGAAKSGSELFQLFAPGKYKAPAPGGAGSSSSSKAKAGAPPAWFPWTVFGGSSAGKAGSAGSKATGGKPVSKYASIFSKGAEFGLAKGLGKGGALFGTSKGSALLPSTFGGTLGQDANLTAVKALTEKERTKLVNDGLSKKRHEEIAEKLRAARDQNSSEQNATDFLSKQDQGITTTNANNKQPSSSSAAAAASSSSAGKGPIKLAATTSSSAACSSNKQPYNTKNPYLQACTLSKPGTDEVRKLYLAMTVQQQGAKTVTTGKTKSKSKDLPKVDDKFAAKVYDKLFAPAFVEFCKKESKKDAAKNLLAEKDQEPPKVPKMRLYGQNCQLFEFEQPVISIGSHVSCDIRWPDANKVVDANLDLLLDWHAPSTASSNELIDGFLVYAPSGHWYFLDLMGSEKRSTWTHARSDIQKTAVHSTPSERKVIVFEEDEMFCLRLGPSNLSSQMKYLYCNLPYDRTEERNNQGRRSSFPAEDVAAGTVEEKNGERPAEVDGSATPDEVERKPARKTSKKKATGKDEEAGTTSVANNYTTAELDAPEDSAHLTTRKPPPPKKELLLPPASPSNGSPAAKKPRRSSSSPNRPPRVVEEPPKLCEACMESTVEVITYPCRHKTLCCECLQIIGSSNPNPSAVSLSMGPQCPLCRATITRAEPLCWAPLLAQKSGGVSVLCPGVDEPPPLPNFTSLFMDDF
ncbi:unnamed protein product [Amoebophrya sp. A120]|nr:unnamed protein product [Amoebophrya sp. A120]|eukprot:GSA120T00023997001.1